MKAPKKDRRDPTTVINIIRRTLGGPEKYATEYAEDAWKDVWADAADIAAARALLDVARNIAGIDEDWLNKAPAEQLRATIREIRADARDAINKAEES